MSSVWAGMAAAFAVAGAADAGPPPASAFGRIPVVVDAAISPNGAKLAILGGATDQRVISIATFDQPGLPILPLGEVEAVGLRWAGDDYVLAQVAYWKDLGPRAAYRFGRNIAVTSDANRAIPLVSYEVDSQSLPDQDIIGVTDTQPARVLVLGLTPNSGPAGGADTRIRRKGESGAIRAIWNVDLATGAGTMVERGNNDTVTWEMDRTGRLRVRLDVDQLNHNVSAFGRAGAKGNWTPAWSGGAYENRRQYLGYSEPDDAIYLVQGDKVVKRRLADGAEQPVANAGPSLRLVWDQHRNTAAGVGAGREKLSYEWLDPEIGAAAGVFTHAFSGLQVTLEGWSKDRTRFLARVAGPASPGVWYLYDRGRKELSPVAEEYPELKGARLGSTRWITYKARDGLEIPAYVTLPPGAQPGQRLPLIVYPHARPEGRDGYDFDFTAQFLATRGYAVLQPQYRGSSGLDADLEKAGRGEWGGKMQTDLIDGVAALAAAGDIDPTRVCIVGSSFGGYSALAGAAFHSDVYRCAASIGGISDPGMLLVEKARIYGPDADWATSLREQLGAVSGDRLSAESPARHASEAKAPILLIHGDKDTEVPLEQSQRMADQLQAAGKTYELVVLAGENHELAKSSSRTQVLQSLERFLAKNLPVN